MAEHVKDDGVMRKFETGATRDTSKDKLDYEAFLAPVVMKRYAEYLHSTRKQPDGSYRDGDNWQKGIPLDCYMKSKFRHFMDTWMHHRGHGAQVETDMETCLCAELFNTMGYLFEVLESKRKAGL